MRPVVARLAGQLALAVCLIGGYIAGVEWADACAKHKQLLQPALRLLRADPREIFIHKSCPDWAGDVIKKTEVLDLRAKWESLRTEKSVVLLGDEKAHCPHYSDLLRLSCCSNGRLQANTC